LEYGASSEIFVLQDWILLWILFDSDIFSKGIIEIGEEEDGG